MFNAASLSSIYKYTYNFFAYNTMRFTPGWNVTFERNKKIYKYGVA